MFNFEAASGKTQHKQLLCLPLRLMGQPGGEHWRATSSARVSDACGTISVPAETSYSHPSLLFARERGMPRKAGWLVRWLRQTKLLTLLAFYRGSKHVLKSLKKVRLTIHQSLSELTDMYHRSRCYWISRIRFRCLH